MFDNKCNLNIISKTQCTNDLEPHIKLECTLLLLLPWHLLTLIILLLEIIFFNFIKKSVKENTEFPTSVSKYFFKH